MIRRVLGIIRRLAQRELPSHDQLTVNELMAEAYQPPEGSVDEVWRPVPGWEEAYQVSNYGRVRSIDRTCLRSDGIKQCRKGKIISPVITNKYGHKRIRLHWLNKSKQMYVHQIVMLAFVGPCPDEQEVRHLNGNPTDNRLSNLAYGTRKENAADAMRHGTKKEGGLKTSAAKKGIATIWGSAHGRAKLTEDKVKAMRQEKARGVSAIALGAKYGVHACTVNGVCAFRSWRHVS